MPQGAASNHSLSGLFPQPHTAAQHPCLSSPPPTAPARFLSLSSWLSPHRGSRRSIPPLRAPLSARTQRPGRGSAAPLSAPPPPVSFPRCPRPGPSRRSFPARRRAPVTQRPAVPAPRGGAPSGAQRAAAGSEVERLSLPASARPPPRR